MRNVEHPADHPLDTHSECGVRHAPELMDLADPFIPGIVTLAFLSETLIEHLDIVDFLGDAEQFAHPIAGNQVGHARDARVGRIDAVRERLHDTGNPGDPERGRGEKLGEPFFFRAAESLAELDVEAVFLQKIDGIFILDAGELRSHTVQTH